ncbi:MAG: polysaccharide biosynthesis tyrosine autokinase [Mucilaginibacter sp.]|nr:polysaccharide biosynthesis tyrosine autokinase [Mucilaginibacter sp.]
MDYPNKKDFLNLPDEESFDYKEFLGKVIAKWYLFLISVFLCLLASVLYIKYSVPEYKITSKLLVEDQKNSGGGALSNNMITDFSSLFDLPSNAQNEIDILKSRSLMEKVVDQMHLNVTLFRKGRFKYDELFDDAPFQVNIIYKTDSVNSNAYNIEVSGNGFIHLLDDKNDIDIKGKFGDTLKLKGYDLIFSEKSNSKISGNFLLTIVSKDSKVEALTKQIDAQLSDKQSTTIDLVFNYSLSKKGEVILQSLMDNYIKTNLEYKVQTADSTVAFINRRLVIVQKELLGVEKDFSGFKQQNDLANVTEQSKALVTSASDYYNQLNAQEIQLTVVNDLEKYVKDPANKTIIPSSLTDQDPVFANGIKNYNDLLLERDKLNLSYKDTNPVVISLDGQIENVKENLIKSFEAYRKGLQTSKNELKNRNGIFNNKIKSVPEKERVFLDYSRQQNLKQELYLYLLQKKEETMISKTSTISSARIIDNAKSDQEPYKPKHSLIYLIGLAAGLIIPISYISIRDNLNVIIISKQDIEKHTQVPVVAEIGNNSEKSHLVVVENSRTIIAEQFRSLRTNLQYVIKQGGPQVIMITSNMSGEGKTFISLNIGSALAISGKRVVFLELDLRKPKLSNALEMDNLNGFTNYIISQQGDIDSFIKPTLHHENLFLMSSGPIPPNPSEILLSEKFPLLIDQLKKEYDFIIIDSAPVGLVSDALIIDKYVDVSLYVVRQKYTFKNSLSNLNDLIKNNKLKHVYLVVNDIETKKGGYYGYGYGSYGYGSYNYGDYGQDVKKSFFENLIDKFKRT